MLRFSNQLRVVTDFSGLETPSLALDALGIDSTLVAASEIAPKLREVIVENFKPYVMHDSFAVEAAPNPGSVDLYVAGPPCQDFSSAGLQAGTSGSRGCLYEQAVDRIIFLRCRAFILENVVGLATFDKGVFLASMVRKLETAGYCVFHKILDTQDHGLPQRWRRIYVVGCLVSSYTGAFAWPESVAKTYRHKFRIDGKTTYIGVLFFVAGAFVSVKPTLNPKSCICLCFPSFT